MENLWKARVILPGAAFILIICIWSLAYPSHFRWVEIAKNNPALATVGGATVILISGQVILAVSVLILKIAFPLLSGWRNFFDVPYLSEFENGNGGFDWATGKEAYPRLKVLGIACNSFSDLRYALIYFDQQYLAENEAHARSWIARRWNAANGLFGTFFAILAGTLFCWHLTDWKCEPKTQGFAGAAFALAITMLVLGILYRRDMMETVKLLAKKPPRRP